MGKRPENFEATVKFLSEVLAGRSYAIRGTAGLVLQGFDMNVDDIDILCDKDMALDANELLKDYLVKKVEFSESPSFRSYFGSFFINGVQVEIMGNWEIKDNRGVWSGPFVPDANNSKELTCSDFNIMVTTPELELRCFALMGRWNAYKKLKNQLPQ